MEEDARCIDEDALVWRVCYSRDATCHGGNTWYNRCISVGSPQTRDFFGLVQKKHSYTLGVLPAKLRDGLIQHKMITDSVKSGLSHEYRVQVPRLEILWHYHHALDIAFICW